MKILTISTWFPLPPNNGSRIRTYQLLKHLGEKHTVDLLAISQMERDADYMDEVKTFCRQVATFPPKKFHPDQMDSWLSFFSKTPRGIQGRYREEMDTLAQRWAGKEKYDAALAITLGAAPYVAKLDVPFKILDQHNVECRIMKRMWESERALLSRLRYGATWAKAESFERELVSQFDLVTLVSEPERQLMTEVLNGRGTKQMEVVPNGIDPSLLEYVGPQKAQNTLVFSGAMTYSPNLDAAKQLCGDVLPLVRKTVPDTSLRITGGCGNMDITYMASVPGVEFTGYVDDIRPVVASASALVVPLRFGGGTRLKILEAMALGTPVVSTPVGAEGLDITDGVDILLGESPEELAAQTVRLLTDPNLASRVSSAATKLVSERYRWPDIALKFERTVTSALEQSNVRSG